jgi:hypothetical protein
MSNLKAEIDTKKQAVDDLVKYYRSTKSPILEKDIFDLYESILSKKETLPAPMKPE